MPGFIMWDGGRLAAAVFLPRDTAPRAEELEPLTQFLWSGIDHVVAYYFGPPQSDDEAAHPGPVPGVVVRRVPAGS